MRRRGRCHHVPAAVLHPRRDGRRDANAHPRAPANPNPRTHPCAHADRHPHPGTDPCTHPAPTPTPTAQSTPTATPSPTPPPCDGVECIEPAGDIFERRTFESGERIGWTDGIFVMDTETGRIEGYRVWREEDEADGANREDGSAPLYTIEGNHNRWVTAHDGVTSLLLDRTSEHAWRLPAHLRLVTASQDALLMRDAQRVRAAHPHRQRVPGNRAIRAPGLAGLFLPLRRPPPLRRRRGGLGDGLRDHDERPAIHEQSA